jgi:hypothetical protein
MGAIAPIKVGDAPHRRGRGADRSIKLFKLRERGRCVKRALGETSNLCKTRYRN